MGNINIYKLANWWEIHSLTALGLHPNAVKCLLSQFTILGLSFLILK